MEGEKRIEGESSDDTELLIMSMLNFLEEGKDTINSEEEEEEEEVEKQKLSSENAAPRPKIKIPIGLNVLAVHCYTDPLFSLFATSPAIEAILQREMSVDGFNTQELDSYFNFHV